MDLEKGGTASELVPLLGKREKTQEALKCPYGYKSWWSLCYPPLMLVGSIPSEVFLIKVRAAPLQSQV